MLKECLLNQIESIRFEFRQAVSTEGEQTFLQVCEKLYVTFMVSHYSEMSGLEPSTHTPNVMKYFKEGLCPVFILT